MKKILFLLSCIIQTIAFSQDPREFNHGATIVNYQNDADLAKYYLTWSSSFDDSWEHDIYNATIYFDNSGNLIIDEADEVYIGTGTDEAQEPVNATINLNNNYILSVWEDGSDGEDAPNVRGQLHRPNGTIIKENWIIAGGTGSQHSAKTAHLSTKYLVFYADEAPPSDGGAVLKAKVIDEITGDETQSISFTPNDEDHWWPVCTSNSSNTRTLIIWGNDGYATRGTVLYDNAGTIEQTTASQDYLINTQQYYYEVEWLENISQFLLIARNGAYESITDSSQICLIDTLGNLTYSATVKGGILREAKPTVKWAECNATYNVFFPTGIYDLTQISISSEGIISSVSSLIADALPVVAVEWVSTGIWSTFITDIDGNDVFDAEYIALFLMNDLASNDKISFAIHIDSALLCNPLGHSELILGQEPFIVYPNPTNDILRIPANYLNFSYEITAINGQIVKSGMAETTYLDVSNLTDGLYYIKVFENDSDKEYGFKFIKE